MARKLGTDPRLRYLSELLWPGGFAVRSTELTVVFAERFRGPRVSAQADTHPCWELTAVLAGHGTLHAEQSFALRPGVLSLVPAGVRHREEAADLDTVWIGLRGTRLDRLGDQVRMMWHAGHTALAERLYEASESAEAGIGPYLDGLALAITASLYLEQSTAKPALGADPADEARAWIDAHLTQPLVVGALARQLGVSAGHLHRCFHRRFGISLLAHQSAGRMALAEGLLRDGAAVAEAALAAGYRDPFYFSRQFKRLRGVPPSHLRPE